MTKIKNIRSHVGISHGSNVRRRAVVAEVLRGFMSLHATAEKLVIAHKSIYRAGEVAHECLGE